MLPISDAYILGYFSQIIGIHFYGADLLFETKSTSLGELTKRVDLLLSIWSQRGAEAVQNIRVVESLLQKEGFPLDLPPKRAEEYTAWLEAIENRLNEYWNQNLVFSLEAQRMLFPAKWAYAIGSCIGESQKNINLAVLLHYLLEASPENPWFESQLGHLDQNFEQSFTKLSLMAQRTDFLHTFPEITQTLLYDIVSSLEKVNIIGENQTSDQNCISLQNWMKQVANQHQQLYDALKNK